MTTPGILWDLAWVFAPLSLVTVGGGQAVVADIHRQVVDVHGWMSDAEFGNLFAISRMAPGPGTLLVTLIGWQVAGPAGAAVATASIFGPTALLIYGVAHLWHRRQGARWQRALETGLRPVAAGLILASVLVLMTSAEGGWWAGGVAVASTAILLATPVNPLLLLACGAGVFAALNAGGFV